MAAISDLSLVEVGAIVAALGLFVQMVNVALSQVNERRRTQPIVVTHEIERRRPEPERGRWRPTVRIKNEGQGAAFNVRFGVSYFGVRYAFRLHDADPHSGNRQRVLHPLEELGPFPIYVPSLDLWGGRGVPEENAYYWARYENVQGRTWETINPPERSADLKIRRVRFLTLRQKWETRKRRDLSAEGRKVESEVLRDLRERMDETND